MNEVNLVKLASPTPKPANPKRASTFKREGIKKIALSDSRDWGKILVLNEILDQYLLFDTSRWLNYVQQDRLDA